MAELSLLLVGLGTAVFVGLNVGGSSTGVSFGPAVGSGLIGMRGASALMAVFALAGGLLVGPNVVDTLGRGIVPGGSFTLEASIIILFFIGLNILLGNVIGVSSSTSQIAVGAVVGMGVALNVIDWGIVGVIFLWWILSAVIAFWVSVIIGKYMYAGISDVLELHERGRWPRVLVLAVGCYMAFSAGASNVANAVAPLVGSGEIQMVPALLIGGVAMGAGAFWIGPRTMKTIGNEITQLPLEAALIVEVIAATAITLLSWAGIPASLAIVATLSVIGLGWGRAAGDASLIREFRMEEIGETNQQSMRRSYADLFNIRTTRKVVTTWMATPIIAGVLSYVVFEAGHASGLL